MTLCKVKFGNKKNACTTSISYILHIEVYPEDKGVEIYRYNSLYSTWKFIASVLNFD